MDIIELGLLAALAAICAGLGQFLTGYSRGGCPVAFLAALLGALLGPLGAERIGWSEPFVLTLGPVDFPVVTSAVGALLLVLIVNLLTRKRKF